MAIEQREDGNTISNQQWNPSHVVHRWLTLFWKICTKESNIHTYICYNSESMQFIDQILFYITFRWFSFNKHEFRCFVTFRAFHNVPCVCCVLSLSSVIVGMVLCFQQFRFSGRVSSFTKNSDAYLACAYQNECNGISSLICFCFIVFFHVALVIGPKNHNEANLHGVTDLNHTFCDANRNQSKKRN